MATHEAGAACSDLHGSCVCEVASGLIKNSCMPTEMKGLKQELTDTELLNSPLLFVCVHPDPKLRVLEMTC